MVAQGKDQIFICELDVSVAAIRELITKGQLECSLPLLTAAVTAHARTRSRRRTRSRGTYLRAARAVGRAMSVGEGGSSKASRVEYAE